MCFNPNEKPYLLSQAVKGGSLDCSTGAVHSAHHLRNCLAAESLDGTWEQKQLNRTKTTTNEWEEQTGSAVQSCFSKCDDTIQRSFEACKIFNDMNISVVPVWQLVLHLHLLLTQTLTLFLTDKLGCSIKSKHVLEIFCDWLDEMRRTDTYQVFVLNSN